MNKLRYFNSVWRFEICVDSPTYGWVYGFVGWLMDGSFFWHLTAYLNHLSPLQGYFGEFWMGYMEEHISTMSSTMLAITQFQVVDTPRFTHSMTLKCEILHIDEGALPPTTPINPYLGARAWQKWTTFQIPRTFSSHLWNTSLFRWFKFTLKPPKIASCITNYDWPFGTLPFGLFWSNLDTRNLETYPRTYSGHFLNMSLFDDSRAIWVLFRKWVVSENRILLGNGWPKPGYSDLVLGGEVPRLNHWPICFPIQNI